MCVDVSGDQRKAVSLEIVLFLGVLCLGVGLRKEPPGSRKACYMLMPWLCVKGLAFNIWASCLWVFVFRQV